MKLHDLMELVKTNNIKVTFCTRVGKSTSCNYEHIMDVSQTLYKDAVVTSVDAHDDTLCITAELVKSPDMSVIMDSFESILEGE